MTWSDLFLMLSRHPVLMVSGLVFLFAARIALYAKAGHPFFSALIPFYAEWTFALGLCFVNPVFMPVLAFGSSRYRLAA